MIISVALCTYNGEKYIEQQLESIFIQSVAVSEIVVCDDCSSDSTVQKIKQMSFLHPNVIRLVTNPYNMGFRKNFEKALRECQGDYIFFCDQDDIWNPDKVEKSIAYLKSSGNYGLFTDAELIDRDNKEIGKSLFECMNVFQYINKRNLYPDLLATLCLSDNFVTGATVAVSKEAKPILIPSWPSDGLYHDYYVALKLSAIGKFGYLTDKLISYRIHPSQQTGVLIDSSKKIHLFDYNPDTDRQDVLGFLLRRRERTLYISSECKLCQTERKKLKILYREYFCSVIKGIPIPSRLKVFLLYCKTELYVATYPTLRRCWISITNSRLIS